MNRQQKISNTISFYDTHAVEYAAKVSGRAPKELIKKFTKYVGKRGKVLDVGCAAGRDSRQLKARGFEVIGIDLSKKLLEEARKKDSESQYLYMNMANLEFEDESFDGIYASASLLYLPSI